jgi:hypothetical protein
MAPPPLLDAPLLDPLEELLLIPPEELPVPGSLVEASAAAPPPLLEEPAGPVDPPDPDEEEEVLPLLPGAPLPPSKVGVSAVPLQPAARTYNPKQAPLTRAPRKNDFEDKGMGNSRIFTGCSRGGHGASGKAGAGAGCRWRCSIRTDAVAATSNGGRSPVTR